MYAVHIIFRKAEYIIRRVSFQTPGAGLHFYAASSMFSMKMP